MGAAYVYNKNDLISIINHYQIVIAVATVAQTYKHKKLDALVH